MSDEPEVPAFGLEDAKRLIERMKLARQRCWDQCIEVPAQVAAGGYEATHGGFSNQLLQTEQVDAWMLKQGFERVEYKLGYMKRCATCAADRMFPWADKLDPQRVLDFVLTDPRCEQAFELSILEDTLKPQPVLVQIVQEAS
jgi:hypothetical protein